MTVRFSAELFDPAATVFGLIGACIGLLGAAISGWLAYQRLVGAESLSNRPLLLLGILLIVTGVQLVTIGLVAEMQARTYHESQGKPTYAIREIRETAVDDRLLNSIS
jgi:dolichol-phosphate mannosyltransferase